MRRGGGLLRVLAFRQRQGGTGPSQDWANEEGDLMESSHGDSLDLLLSS